MQWKCLPNPSDFRSLQEQQDYSCDSLPILSNYDIVHLKHLYLLNKLLNFKNLTYNHSQYFISYSFKFYKPFNLIYLMLGQLY